MATAWYHPTCGGWSYDKGEPILIYEYMPNGSLDQHLFRRSGGGKQQQQQPDLINRWDTRYNMVKDIATGLHYVHHEYEPTVLHRDIKANNIMIDPTFQGRLGDFGLACVVPHGKNSYTDKGAPGTIGFRMPEYIQSGKATTKSDIFAFGVLILEIVTGKAAVDAQFRHLTDWVWHHHKEGRLLNAVDSQLTMDHEYDDEDAKRLLLLGLACSQPNPSDRPNMVDAVKIITKLAPPPDVPPELSSFSRSRLTIGVEMTAGVASFENGGNILHHRPTAGPSHALLQLSHFRVRLRPQPPCLPASGDLPRCAASGPSPRRGGLPRCVVSRTGACIGAPAAGGRRPRLAPRGGAAVRDAPSRTPPHPCLLLPRLTLRKLQSQIVSLVGPSVLAIHERKLQKR
ncbi:hypothetical protein U9M48_030542 [Paspalum notatum var. saurae]|uniref:Protein kinase domain-containing protein n=1 Tax=Paspalum notatum var. saurae TaxID=547442 RepID=A0AAQ3U0L3_PASNO